MKGITMVKIISEEEDMKDADDFLLNDTLFDLWRSVDGYSMPLRMPPIPLTTKE